MTQLRQDIARAARQDTLCDAALYYAAMGLSVIPCRGKTPALTNWKPFQARRATVEDVVFWDTRGLLQNVGIVCGRVSDNLVVIDLDGQQAVNAFLNRFPALLDTYAVETGSGNGLHLYYYTRVLPASKRVVGTAIGNIEMRADGLYVVAPPSIHPDTKKPYAVLNRDAVMIVHNLDDVAAWIQSFRPQPEITPRQAQPIQKAQGWAGAALSAECQAVRLAPAGARNNTLNRAAFKLGQLVQRGLLTRQEIEYALYDAAGTLAESDGEMSVIRTIESGLTAGMTKPIWRENA